jgi:hypothetical protein
MHEVQPTNTRYTRPKKSRQDREEKSHKEDLKRSVERGRDDPDGDRSVP